MSMRPKRIPATAPSRNSARTVVCVSVFLALAVFLIFGRTFHYGFVNYDDDHHVYANAAVTNGITLDGAAWAFRHSQSDYWHPLDFLSHMLDCQIFGLNAGGHHFTNVLLHAAVAILLFLVLRSMTGALWTSAFIAAVFAVHPLRVESVAWISERKDVLHGLFFALTLAAYVHYVRKPAWGGYLLVLVSFALGLMAKPTLMALPLMLLLLDYWPLRRLSNPRRIIVEKIPMLLLSVASCLEAAAGNRTAFESSKAVPFSLQISNAIVSCAEYLRQTLWPVDLAVFYPFPINGISAWKIIISAALLIGISVAVIFLRARRPYLMVGWFWFLVMLAPMAGLIQAGAYARADRYTYLPQIGIILALTFGARDLAATLRIRESALWAGAAASLAILSWLACAQTAHWRNSESLWRHALSCTSENFIAANNLGTALVEQKRFAEAAREFQRAVDLNPRYAQSYYNLGLVLAEQGELDAAISRYRAALERNPDYAAAYNNLGIILANQGQAGEALESLAKACAINSNYAEAHNNRGIVLASQGRYDQAVAAFERAISIDPKYADAHFNLGNAYVIKAQLPKAAEQYEEVLRLNPGSDAARQQLEAIKQQPR